MAKEITDASFDKEVVNSDSPVLIDFWAGWCGPCRMLAPVIEELSADLKGKVEVCKMNIDENPETPSRLGIRSIPTLILFKKGEILGTKLGVSTKTSIEEWIKSLV